MECLTITPSFWILCNEIAFILFIRLVPANVKLLEISDILFLQTDIYQSKSTRALKKLKICKSTRALKI